MEEDIYYDLSHVRLYGGFRLEKEVFESVVIEDIAKNTSFPRNAKIAYNGGVLDLVVWDDPNIVDVISCNAYEWNRN